MLPFTKGLEYFKCSLNYVLRRLFAIPRTVGWLAHMSELLKDKEQKISRPRQWYTGVDERPYVAITKR